MTWAPIEGFPGYSVSEDGEVRHDANMRPIRPQVNQMGIPYVGMMRGYDQKKRGLARIVATAFIPRDMEAFDTPINLDGNRMNCSVENLMWRPRWFAIQYNQQFREPYKHAITRPLRLSGTKEVYPTSMHAACRYGLLERDIVLSIYNNTYTWPTYQYFEIVE